MELDKTHYKRPFYRSYYFFISLEITTNYVLKVVIQEMLSLVISKMKTNVIFFIYSVY